jgi:hypothetical protein
VDLGEHHQHPVHLSDPDTEQGFFQQQIAHEFGHTIGLPDEYGGWAEALGTGWDKPSIMNLGNELRPRHYQPFADLLNLKLGSGRCGYAPEGVPSEYEVPVERWTRLPVSAFNELAEFVVGPTYDRRVSNQAVLGVAHPTVGMTSFWNPRDGSIHIAPTVGLQLNHLLHPVYVNVRTGAVFDPRNPRTTLDLRIPFSLDFGLRRPGWELGIDYTYIPRFLGSGGWTHLIGVSGRF